MENYAPPRTALRDHRQGDSRFEAVAEHDFARQRHQFFRLRAVRPGDDPDQEAA